MTPFQSNDRSPRGFRVPSKGWAALLGLVLTGFALTLNLWLPTPTYATDLSPQSGTQGGQQVLAPLPVLASHPLGRKENLSSLAIGDINGDGYLDIVTAGGREDTPGPNRIYTNDGTGRFDSPALILEYSPPSGARQVVLADMDGDGTLDIVAGSFTGPNLLFLNDGSGRFGEPQSFGEDQVHTRAIAVGDLNGDGAYDVVAGTGCSAEACAPNRIFYNDGFGSLGELDDSRILGLNSQHDTRSVALGYVDDDGSLDIIVGNWDAPNQVFLNDGQGGFDKPEMSLTFGQPSQTRDLEVGDVNGDRKLDLIEIVNEGSDIVYLNSGQGTLTQSQVLESGAYSDLVTATLADVNADGYLDLIAGAGNALVPEENVVLLNDGAGVFQPSSSFGSISTTADIAVADVNGDGVLDMVVGNTENAVSWVYLRESHNIFAPAGDLAALDDAVSVALGDMDGNGYLDIVLLGGAGQPNSVYLNDGSCLSSLTCPSYPFGAGSEDGSVRTGLALADLNRDNYLDVVEVAKGQNYLHLNEALSEGLGLAGAISFGFDGASLGVAVADLNGDGHLDIVEANDGQDYVYINDGHGVFPATSAAVRLGTSQGRTQSVAVGDIDQDGHIDIVAGSDGRNMILTNRGNGLEYDDLSFGKEDSTLAVALADLNSDQRLDIVVANGFGDLSQVYLNDGTGHYPSGTPFGGFRTSQAVAVDDLDGDGDLDAVIARTRDTEVYTNDGEGVFGEPIRVDSDWGYSTTGAAVGDLDSDGLPDLVVSHGGRPRRASRLLFNRLRSTTGLVNHPPYIAAGYPASTHIASYYFSPRRLMSRYIAVPYALFDPEGDSVGRVTASYSLDGGGSWLPAVPKEGTATAHLATSEVGATHRFDWDTLASGVFGRSDNVVLRIEAYSAPAAGAVPGTYQYPHRAAARAMWPGATAATAKLRVQGTQVQVMDEMGEPIAGAYVYRLPQGQSTGARLMPDPASPLRTDAFGYLPGRGVLADEDQLMAVLPVTPTQPISFTNQYHYYYASAAPQEDGLEMDKVSRTGVIALTIPTGVDEAVHPLMLFDLVVSAEWDVSDDELFLVDLEEGFERASELFYDVTNGQAAIGRVHVFPAKTYWNRADMVIYASNNMRPSAAIGGVVNEAIAETVVPARGESASETVPEAYVPGQIRMGTAWDPFGDNSSDLSEQWWRALAHELAHHLLFLPDNYVGLKPDERDPDKRYLGRIDCKGSFMTTTHDPSYTEFLTEAAWLDDCKQSLAEQTTGRTDWKTITAFYPMLREPTGSAEGPSVLPLDVTHLVPWKLMDGRTNLPARNFDLRDEDTKDRMRLPDAQVYLFQTQGTQDPTDDVLIPLGSPTDGGDRIKVRGAVAGDRLCLFDYSDRKQTRAGCIERVSGGDVSIPVTTLEDEAAERWAPVIEVKALTTQTLAITMTQQLHAGAMPQVQVFPAHYPSAPGIAPVAGMNRVGDGMYRAVVGLPLPASDVSVRVWLDDNSKRESITQFFLQLPWQGNQTTVDSLDFPVVDGSYLTVVGGDNRPVFGGPEYSVIGGGNKSVVGGGNKSVVGGGNKSVVGGGNKSVVGGGNKSVVGGGNKSVVGGGNKSVVGGGNKSVVGGGNKSVVGGGNKSVVGGGNKSIVGGADYPAVSGAPSSRFAAPALSSDSQVVVYDQNGLFEPSGIESMQILPTPPEVDDEPWLMPVGQAYYVEPERDVRSVRTIAFNYLQKAVPEGYEHTLAIYFLPKSAETWERLDSRQFVENMVVADLKQEPGTYAVMSTVALPELHPGWNVFAYPLPDARQASDALASIAGKYSHLLEAVDVTAGLPESLGAASPEPAVEILVPRVNLRVREGPGVDHKAVSFLRRGERVGVIGVDRASGWKQIECPAEIASDTECWVSGSAEYSSSMTPAVEQESEPVEILPGAIVTDQLQFGHVYLIWIDGDQSVTAFLAPPKRGPDGVVPGSN